MEKVLPYSKLQFLYPSSEKYSKIILASLKEMAHVKALCKGQNAFQKQVDIFQWYVGKLLIPSQNDYQINSSEQEKHLPVGASASSRPGWLETLPQLIGFKSRAEGLPHGLGPVP